MIATEAEDRVACPRCMYEMQERANRWYCVTCDLIYPFAFWSDDAYRRRRQR